MDKEVEEMLKLGTLTALSLAIGVTFAKCSDAINNYHLDKQGIKIDDTYISRMLEVDNYDDFFTIPFYANNYEEDDIVYARLDKQTRKYKIIKVNNKLYKPFTLELKENEIEDLSLFMKHGNTYTNIVPINKKTITVFCQTHHKRHKFTTYSEALTKESLKKIRA